MRERTRHPGGRSLAAMGAAAFFDLDKTIIAKSSVLAFGRPFYREGLLSRRAIVKSMYAADRLHARRRGRVQDGRGPRGDAVAHQGLAAGPRRVDRRRDARRRDLAHRLRRGPGALRRAPPRRSDRGDRLVLPRRGREAARCVPRRRPCDRDPRAHRRGRCVHRRAGVLRVRSAQGDRDRRVRRGERDRPRGLVRLLGLDHRRPDARRRRPPRGGEPRQGPRTRVRRARLGGPALRASRPPT